VSREAEVNWSEEVCVGSILLQYTGDLLKAYPPFVNFFERTKNQIGECDKRSPRFHAFLKKCERRPECSRQTLTGTLAVKIRTKTAHYFV
jgi:hypothetical protein